RCYLSGSNKCPMLFPFGALLDPAADEFHLGFLEGDIRIGWRHLLVGIGAGDPAVDFAFGRGGWFDYKTALLRFAERAFFSIETKFGFAGFFVRTVALPATIGEQGANLQVEIHLFFRCYLLMCSD